MIHLVVRFADKARREGLLSLENDAKAMDVPLLKQGIFLVIDGTDPETIRDILSTDLHYQEMNFRAEESIFTTLGGFAPTLGIIGTVMGLIHMLAQLNDPGKMGPLIAGAFIATLYGVTSANLIFLPIAHKLRAIAGEEILLQEVILEGVLAIQAGNSPRLVEERLKSYVAPRQRAITLHARGGKR
ncbi:MAG: MotA/TolQ/ExbB proton channel family protein [Armatimonadetes bacterium]|nr:MotA/TolQ/ExbB proton channel family protein [Armatimonadota bacterium]